MKFNENEIEKLRSCIGTEEVLKFEVMNHMGVNSDIYARVAEVKNDKTIIVTLQTVAEQIQGKAKTCAIELRTNLEQPLKYIPSYEFPVGFLIERIVSHKLENPIYENSEKTLARAKKVADKNLGGYGALFYYGEDDGLEMARYLGEYFGKRVQFRRENTNNICEGVIEGIARSDNENFVVILMGGTNRFVSLEEDYEFKVDLQEDYPRLFEENKEEETTLNN